MCKPSFWGSQSARSLAQWPGMGGRIRNVEERERGWEGFPGFYCYEEEDKVVVRTVERKGVLVV